MFKTWYYGWHCALAREGRIATRNPQGGAGIVMRCPPRDLPAFYGGAVERLVALTLVLWAPPYLPSFIGGWVLLKFAIGWQREGYGGKDEDEVAKGRFLALIGNVLSFAIAIGVGVFLNPAAL
jgi:hypothetical protein